MRCATDSVCRLSLGWSLTRLVTGSPQWSDWVLSQFQATIVRELGLKAVTHEQSVWAVLRLDGPSRPSSRWFQAACVLRPLNQISAQLHSLYALQYWKCSTHKVLE